MGKSGLIFLVTFISGIIYNIVHIDEILSDKIGGFI